jgi:hypothetical protein
MLYLLIGIMISALAIFKSDEIIESTTFVGFVMIFIMGIVMASAGGIALSGQV